MITSKSSLILSNRSPASSPFKTDTISNFLLPLAVHALLIFLIAASAVPLSEPYTASTRDATIVAVPCLVSGYACVSPRPLESACPLCITAVSYGNWWSEDGPSRGGIVFSIEPQRPHRGIVDRRFPRRPDAPGNRRLPPALPTAACHHQRGPIDHKLSCLLSRSTVDPPLSVRGQDHARTSGKPLKARSSPGHRLSEHPTKGWAWMAPTARKSSSQRF